MRILSLSIRNIASVERGDIDFEKDLLDKTDGMPAPLFLITGDTGSGKSVILDSISMALYGTTPRVRGVNGVKNNVFRTSVGEEISVSDISQYTRLGISHKDPCYAELTFEGNDGIRYISRFSLGYTNRRTLRTPQWRLQIGDDEVIEGARKDEIRRRIQEAVGLSFEQFGRMAMLAQGQFATFLTGKKEERERILEQLTATDRFSRYGEAIANIFRRAKEARNDIETRFHAYRDIILPEEERKQMEKELADTDTSIIEKEKAAASLSEYAGALRELMRLNDEERRLESELNKTTEEEKSESHRRDQELVARWDTTTRQRAALTEKRHLSARVKQAEATLRQGAIFHSRLQTDLAKRIEEKVRNERELTVTMEWIEARKPLQSLFGKVALLTDKVAQWIKTGKEITEGQECLIREEATLNKMVPMLTEAADRVAALEKDRTRLREQTEELIKARDRLQPDLLAVKKEEASQRRIILLTLTERLAEDNAGRKETADLVDEIAGKEKDLTELRNKARGLAAKHEKVRGEAEKAAARYTTMHLSVEENFRELRRRLRDEHASVCPLCGHSDVDFSLGDEETFTGILSPLLEEKNRLARTCATVEEEVAAMNRNVNTREGHLSARNQELGRLTRRDAERKKEIERLMENLPDYSITDPDVIPELIRSLDEELSDLDKRIAEADSIGKTIESLLKDNATLDKEKSKAEDTLKSISAEHTRLLAGSEALSRSIEEKGLRREELKRELDDYLSGFDTEWVDHPAATSDRIVKEAEEYASRVAGYTDEVHTLGRLSSILTELEKSNRYITGKLAGISTVEKAEGYDPAEMPLESVREEWRQLELTVAASIDTMIESRKGIAETEVILTAYYSESDTDEEALSALMEAEESIAGARGRIEALRLRRNTCVSSLKKIQTDREKLIGTLGLHPEEKVPDPEIPEADRKKIVGEIASLNQRRGAIGSRLRADSDNRVTSDALRMEMERKTEVYDRWNRLNNHFGGNRFRTLVQSYILRPLLRQANIYLTQITDHYTLTCSEENEQLSILVLDRYNKNERRSVTVLSGGERFMISLALSLALSAMNRPDMNVDILFIDEGFGTLDTSSLESVISTLRRLPEIAGQNGRRVGVISHREELAERIDVRIRLRRCGEGRNRIEIE